MPSTSGLPYSPPAAAMMSPNSILCSPKAQEYMDALEDHNIDDDDAEMECLDDDEEEEFEELENHPPSSKNNRNQLDNSPTSSSCNTPSSSRKRNIDSVPRKSSSATNSVYTSPSPARFKLKPVADVLKQQTSAIINNNRLYSSQLGALYSGSKFVGEQLSARQSYQVNVELKSVDIQNSFACGYIRIQGLTDECSELTTCFEAEIIGKKHSFLTSKWDADSKIDEQHWTKFPGFEGLQDTYQSEDFEYDFENQPYIFMRWKEKFLVPDHRITVINGASFAGFYYICLEVATGKITGFYFHQNSEWFQHLKLEHIAENAFESFEFR